MMGIAALHPSDELRIKRTMDAAAIDSCIAQAIEARLIDDEKRRRRDWQQRQASAARFVAVQAPYRGLPAPLQ
jgi:hypothetical protein